MLYNSPELFNSGYKLYFPGSQDRLHVSHQSNSRCLDLVGKEWRPAQQHPAAQTLSRGSSGPTGITNSIRLMKRIENWLSDAFSTDTEGSCADTRRTCAGCRNGERRTSGTRGKAKSWPRAGTSPETTTCCAPTNWKVTLLRRI